jgi:BirA family biotin operon repressor/biotin-[acetyl-CoA-carboxylase] ligase
MPARVFRHELVDSTNERALAAVADGSARHLDAHVAEAQSAGRGRLGRAWASPAGEGVYLSLVLLPTRAPHPAALTMAAGLGVLRTVRALGVASARLKWPNDVLALEDGALAKLAGILVETRGLDPARPHAVVGVGLNVRQREFAAELVRERAVTSLARLGLVCTCDEALATLLTTLSEALERAVAAPEAVARDYAAACELVGRAVRVRDGRGEHVGRLVALDLGGLELALASDARERVALEHALAVEPLA